MGSPASFGTLRRRRRLRTATAVLFGVGLAILPVLAGAAGTETSRRRVSFEEALATAMRHNRVLRAAELESRAAGFHVGEARGAMLPQLDALENYSNSNNPTVVFSNLLNQQDFSANNFNLDRLNHPASFSNFQSQIRLMQTIFAGGRLWAGLKASDDAASAARWRAIRARQQIVFAVVQAYYGAVLAEQRVSVLEQALAAAEAHRTQAANLLAHGMVVKADVLRTQVLAGSLEQERNDARNALVTAWDTLAHTVGEEDEPIAPLSQPPELTGPAPQVRGLEELTVAATARRPEIQAAQAEVDRAQQALAIARANYMPTLGVAAAYENDSEELARAGNSYSVFVTAQLNLFDGLATSSKIAAAKADLDRVRELRDELVKGIALEVQAAYHALAAATENLGVAERSEKYAAEALRILEDRYASGLVTNVEVLDAETAHKEAALRLAEARVGVMVDRAALDLAAGKSADTKP